MTFEVALFLLQDALTNGAIYVLMALGIVLVFNVTRVAFISFGDLIAYSSLTLATLQSQQFPGTVWLLATLSVLAVVMEAIRLARVNMLARLPHAIFLYLLLPFLPVLLALLAIGRSLPQSVEIALTVALVLPISPLLYRVVFQPIAASSTLVLLMTAVALHFALSGLALLYFGPEGQRTASYLDGVLSFSTITISFQNLLVIASAVALSAALYLYFTHTVGGKALRATAINRIGAQLSGIRTVRMSSIAFTLAGMIAAVAGVLMGPVTTIYYDTGFLVGLKGFVGAILGGFVNYPLAALGALLVGLIESYSSFYSSALKDVIVFGAIVPITILRWYWSSSADADDEKHEET